MAKSSLPVVRHLLTEAGYRVLLRTSGWAECFVQREGERWEGRGQTEDDALDDALGRMFPSHVARTLLERAVLRWAVRTDASAARLPLVAIRERALSLSLEGPLHQTLPAASYAPITTAPIEPASLPAQPTPSAHDLGTPLAHQPRSPSAVEQPAIAAAPETTAALEPDIAVPSAVTVAVAIEGPGSAPAPPSPLRLEAVAPPILVDSRELAPTSPARGAQVEMAVEARLVLAGADLSPPANEGAPEKPIRTRTAEALESVERLLAAIEDRIGPLARMSADRQRLHMMVWICRARAIEEAHPGAREVEHAVARVARRLTEIGKMFWPGSVRALQLSARPADVRREMHASWASEPANWHEATVLAERMLEEHLSKSTEMGLDEDGWSDGAARTPRPADPDALFDEVDAELKAMLAPPGEVPNGRMSELTSAEFEQLVQAARKLRWLRGAVRDDLAWGVAVGRVRRSVPSLGERSGRVRDVLDHRTRPPGPWAKLLGELTPEPVTPAGESPAELTAALPAAIVTKDSLLAWLIRAFDVFNTPDLVQLLVPIKHYMIFDEETLNHPDRRVRRRLRELVKRVASATAEGGAVKEPAVREVVEETSEEPLAAHALDALAAHVRVHTQGRKALFVSNREDPELGHRLHDLLGLEITWCDGSLRRVQAMCERIKGGTYHMVLSATGFQVHGVDSALARASSTAGVRYVRVNRGRPIACVQAIAREFGLRDHQSGTFSTISAKAAP